MTMAHVVYSCSENGCEIFLMLSEGKILPILYHIVPVFIPTERSMCLMMLNVIFWYD